MEPWETFGNEDDVAGAAIADVNRDGWLDLVVGHHYNSTLSRGVAVPVRLYLNRTANRGRPDRAGRRHRCRRPHRTADQGASRRDRRPRQRRLARHPHQRIGSGRRRTRRVPSPRAHRRRATVLRLPKGSVLPQYWVTAPTADVDRDGRLDVLAVEWEPSLPSILFRNEIGERALARDLPCPGVSGAASAPGRRVRGWGRRRSDRAAGQPRDRRLARLHRRSRAHSPLRSWRRCEVDVVVTPPLPHQPVTLTRSPPTSTSGCRAAAAERCLHPSRSRLEPLQRAVPSQHVHRLEQRRADRRARDRPPEAAAGPLRGESSCSARACHAAPPRSSPSSTFQIAESRQPLPPPAVGTSGFVITFFHEVSS